MQLSDKSIKKLKEILERKKVFLDNLELQDFGKFVLTVGCEVLKFKEKMCYTKEATHESNTYKQS